ncbi:MAG TPA: tetratricopeptide repeat protein [Actinospica sp.]|jgi:tetratricopeptide (TPR) repeat protein|nr:tetratricopeptide repeat protein [Actinospica sp.]
MKSFPGEAAAWTPKDQRAAGLGEDRWHVYYTLHGRTRRLSALVEETRRVALDALGPDRKDLISPVAPGFLHATVQQISLPAHEITPAQLQAFTADLGGALAGIEPFTLQMRGPVAATGSLEGDIYDPHPHQPWQQVSDLVGRLIREHFGSRACTYEPPPPHMSIAYGAPGADGPDALLFDSGIIQSRLRRLVREHPVTFRVGELALLCVHQDPDQSTYTWSQDTAVYLGLGTGVYGFGDGPVGSWLGQDPQRAADAEAAGALDGLEADEQCAGAALGAGAGEARIRLAGLVDAGVLGYRAGRYRLLDAADPEPCDGLDHARDRLLDWYLAAAGRALEWTGNDSLSRYAPAGPAAGTVIDSFEAGRAWFEAERENLRKVVPGAYAHGRDEQCWRLAALWCGYLATNSHFTYWAEAVETGLRAARRARDDRGTAMMLEFRGKLLTQSGHYEHGEVVAREALELRERAGDADGMLRSTNALGLTLRRAGQLEAAEESFREALNSADEQGPVGLRIATRINLGNTLIAMNRVKEAEAVLRAAVALAEPGCYVGYLADALQNLALALRAVSRLQEAVTAGHQAVDAARRTGSQPHLTVTLIALAETLSATGEHNQALDTARQACVAARRPGDPARVRAVMRRAAALAENAGNHHLAAALNDQASD